MTVDVDGTAREFLLRSPAHAGSDPLPVVVALHGLGGSAEEFETAVGMTDRIAQDGFIAVYPQGALLADGLTRGWNAGNCCNVIGEPEADDIDFLAAILKVLPQYGADGDRVFLAGFSNGGMLAYRAACELGDDIAGIAVVSGAFNVSDCPSTTTMPVIIVHGTSDDFIPYAGGDSPRSITDGLKPFTNPSVRDAVEVWIERNGCDGADLSSPSRVVERVSYSGCEAGSSVDFFTIDGGFHVWPLAEWDFDATGVILSEFVED